MRVHLALRRSLIYLLPLALLFVALTMRFAASDLLERLSLFCFDLYQKAAPREAGDGLLIEVEAKQRQPLEQVGGGEAHGERDEQQRERQ